MKGDAAAKRLQEFRYVLGVFLDLVVIDLAGGAGVESALADASSEGDGWHLLASVAVSTAPGTPGVALGQLGEELGVADL